MQTESLSVPEACRLSGVFPPYVYSLLVTGRLDGHKDPDGRWVISRTSFESWLEARKKRKAGGHA